MTIDEKLDNFYSLTIEDATEQSNKIIEEYKNSLDKILEDYEADKRRKAQIDLRLESEHCLREKNRVLSLEQLAIRKKINEKTKILVDNLFEDIKIKVEHFMTTPEYDALLISQINTAKSFAKGEAFTLYINSSDASKKASFESKTGVPLTISEIPFIGGTRAVISSKNVLIDNSFSTKLEEQKKSFKL